jgi:CIC family chloride channel protein
VTISTDPSPIDDQRVTKVPVRPRRTITWPFDFAFQEERFFLILSVFIGIFSALAVVCFRLAIEWFRLKMLGPRLTPSGPHLIIAPTLVGLLVAVLVLHVFPAVRGSGVNQTKAAL